MQLTSYAHTHPCMHFSFIRETAEALFVLLCYLPRALHSERLRRVEVLCVRARVCVCVCVEDGCV